MALTKVKLIADGVITSANLDASHGITTSDIGEGSNLYYTDSRVSSYLSTNGFATQTDIVAAITDSAPVTLDTLNELAAALGDDPNFATTTATSLGLKAPLASPSFTGNATFAGTINSDNITVGKADGNNSSISLTANTGNWTFTNVQSNRNLEISDSDGTGTVMTIDTSGNVGIGETTLTGVNTILDLKKTGTNQGTNIRFKNDYNSNLYIGIQGDSSGNALIYNQNNSDIVMYTGSSGTERMRIDSDGFLLVGGTDSPSTSWKGTAVFGQQGTNKIIIGYLTAFSENVVGGHNSALDAWDSLTLAGTDFKFRTGSGATNTSMVLDSSGLATFKKSGTNARFYDGSTSSTGAIEFGLSDFIFGYDSGVFKHKIWDGADYFNAIEYNGPSHRLILVPSEGSVGIGTTTPSALLDFGTSIQDNKIHLYASGNDKYGMGIRGSQFLFYSGGLGDGDGGITFGKMTGTTYAENMRVTNDGNVGIGTASPSPKLHLKYAGGTYSNDSTSGFINEATTGRGTMRIRSATDNPAELFFDTNGAIRWDISCRNGSSPNLQFYPQAATPALNNVAAHTFELQQNGNVVVTGNGSSGRMGIGTTSPSEIFHVNKNATSRIVGAYLTNSQANTGAEAVSIAFGLNRSGGDFVRKVEAIEFGATQQWTGTPSTVNSYLAFNVVKSESAYERMRVTTNGVDVTSSGAHGVHLKPDTADTNNSGRLFLTRVGGSGWAIMNNSTNFSIRSGAIPNSTSGTEKIRLTGYSATSWTSGSDETIKENIKPISNVLDKINDYRCVEYNLIDDETKDKKIGFIAQDWQKDFPQIIEEMENEKIGMKYTETIPILLKAIQELKADNDNLRERIQTLENQ